VHYTHKAYVNSKGFGQAILISHDIKKALADSKVSKGLVTVTSVLGTTSVILAESDLEMVSEFAKRQIEKLQTEESPYPKRRSGSGTDSSHFLAIKNGLTLTLGVDLGKLSTSPFHDIFALDFDTKPGRREFIITVVGDGSAPPQSR
jgi:thiamine phosphate synthase YjbQ (UPF0047 family)